MMRCMKHRGFTLIELLVAIFIAGILLVVGVPAMRHLIIANKSQAEIEHIVSGLQFARSEAITLGENVKYCGSKDGKVCDGDWAQRRIIVTSSGIVLRVFAAIGVGESLSLNGSFGKDDYLEFTPLGNTNGQSGSFTYKAQTNKGYKIIVSNTGRIRVQSL